MKRLGLTLIVLALLVGAVAWWSTPAPLDPGVTTQLASNEGLPSVAAPHRSSLSTEPGSPSPLEAEVSESHNQGDADPTDSLELQARARAKADDLIAKFEAETVYPSWSRPADGSNRHVVEWNQPESIGQPFAEDAEGREIRADLQLSRMFVGPGETQVAKVSASVVEDGAPAALDEVKISLDWFDGNGWQSALELPVVRDGDGWRAEVVPAAVPALRARPVDVRIRAYVRAGEMDRELAIGFRYTAGESLRVLGLAGDQLDQGDLLLHLEVEVAVIAPILLQATLFAADGQRALAVYEDYHRPSQVGRQILPLRIYGRILNEAGLDGSFRLGRIHGFVYRQELEPREQFFARAEDPPLVTGSYRAANFRSEAYDSPEKREQLARYRGLQPASR
jgi:hypothetical protein